MTPSTDSLALLLLCSQLGLNDESIKPMTLREWNPLARRLHAASLRPSDLLTVSTTDSPLELSNDERARIASLVSRDIQRELNHLAALGIYPITRADPDYPERYRQRLKDSAPSVLFILSSSVVSHVASLPKISSNGANSLRLRS